MHEVGPGRGLHLAHDLEPVRRHRTRLRPALAAGLLVLSVPGLLALLIGDRAAATDAPGVRAATATGSPSTSLPTTSSATAPATPADAGPAASLDPLDIRVLVSRDHPLPAGWVPPDLTVPDVAFNFAGSDQKRMLRREAAVALEALFAAAAGDGLPLVGVSAYRSEARQRDLFGQYQRRDGSAAERYSAPPGTSEHQAGLGIDVAGADGRCAASDCFGDRPEAAWLATRAHEFGFVVRYPAGKEWLTGYQAEPWHLRYVGADLARHLAATGAVLDELPIRAAG